MTVRKQPRQIISDPVKVYVRNPNCDIVYVRSGHALTEFPEFAVHRNLLDMWTVSHIETGAGPVSVPNAVRSKAVSAALELLRAKSQKDITRAVNKAKRKIRAAEKKHPKTKAGGGSRSEQVATANESGETMARQGIGTVREIPPASTRGGSAMSGYNLPDDVTQADVDRVAWDSDEPFELGPVDVVMLRQILDGLLASVPDESYVG